MHIAVRGAGPPMVMLHGWAMHGGIFAPLLRELESHFTLHVVDLPGHGLSADSSLPLELDAVVREIGARTPRAIWLGWSLGGLVALQAAQTLASSVHALVMIGASPRFVRGDDWSDGMDAAVFAGFADGLAHDYRAAIDRFLVLEAQGSDHAREELHVLRDQVFAAGQPSPARMAAGLALLNGSDLRARLSTMTTPSLWIGGRRDRLVSPRAMQAAAALCGGKFVQIEHGGHAPFLTYPAEVANAILDFHATLPP